MTGTRRVSSWNGLNRPVRGRRRAAVAIIALLGLAPARWAAAAQGRASARDLPPERWAAFTAALDTYVREDSVVGASVILLRNGRIIARHAAGLGDRERREPPDPEAVYHWASITKTLTAVAIMQLRDRGRLSLDDPITRYVPELRQVHDPFGSMDDVTLRMLLSHSSGLQNPTWPYRQGRPWEPFEPTRWEQLVAMMPYQELAFAPGSRFGYSNPAFIYLARVIEALTGDPWAVYVQKNIWTPLGMTRSFVGVSPYHLAGRRAASYTLRADSGREHIEANPREFDPGITMPNGGWNAPLADLVRLGLVPGPRGARRPGRGRAATMASCATPPSRRCGVRWCRWRPGAVSTRRSGSRSTCTAGVSAPSSVTRGNSRAFARSSTSTPSRPRP